MRARIVLEEFQHTDIYDRLLRDAMKSLRKRGYSLTLISTEMPEDPAERRAIDQDCDIKISHRCGSWDSAMHSETWATSLVDPYEVHHTTERVIQDGFESVERTQTTHGYSSDENVWGGPRRVTSSTTRSIQDRPMYRSVFDEHFMSVPDQRFLNAVDIQRFGVGVRQVTENGHCRKEYVKLAEPRCCWPAVIETEIEEWLQEMRQSDFYLSPKKGEIEIPCYESPLGKSGNGKQSRGSGRIHQHTRSSKKSRTSRATKRAKGTSASGNGKGSSNSSAE